MRVYGCPDAPMRLEDPPARPARVAIVGAGAVGSTLGAYASRAGHLVTLVDGWADHLRAINGRGLEVRGPRGSFIAHPRTATFSAEQLDNVAADVVFIAGKTVQNEELHAAAQRVRGAQGMVASTQNGLNEDLLTELFGCGRVVGVVTELSAQLVGPGRVLESRRDGEFVVGDPTGEVPVAACRRVAEIMSSCCPIRISDNIVGVIWAKLWWNCAINPVTAITGWGQGRVLADTPLREVLAAIGREVAAVAEAAGIELGRLELLNISPAELSRAGADTRWAELAQRYERHRDKTTSMSADVRAGRPTEIDALNGAVCRHGKRHGIPVPLNELLVDLVSDITRGARTPGEELRDLLVDSAGALTGRAIGPEGLQQSPERLTTSSNRPPTVR